MPSIYFNLGTPGERGRVILRRVGNRQFFVRPPSPSTKPPTAAALASRQRFREATDCARGVLANAVRRAPFEVKPLAPGERVFTRILQDFLRQPLIRSVDTSGYHGQVGDALRVQTRVGLGIGQVLLTLRRGDGSVIESGAAAQENDTYRYVATQPVPAASTLFAEIVVRDCDGIEARRVVPLAVP